MYLIAQIAGEQIALNAQYIDSVVRVRDPVPVPSSGPFVAGLFAQRSRVLTLIDCQYFVSGVPQEVTFGQTAIVVEIGGYSYGLLVDSVSDILKPEHPPHPPSGALRAGWGSIGTAILEHEGATYLVIEPELLVSPKLARAA